MALTAWNVIRISVIRFFFSLKSDIPFAACRFRKALFYFFEIFGTGTFNLVVFEFLALNKI